MATDLNSLIQMLQMQNASQAANAMPRLDFSYVPDLMNISKAAGMNIQKPTVAGQAGQNGGAMSTGAVPMSDGTMYTPPAGSVGGAPSPPADNSYSGAAGGAHGKGGIGGMVGNAIAPNTMHSAGKGGATK